MARHRALAVAMLAAITLAIPGCTPFRQLRRFFPNHSSEKGPAQEDEFNLYLERASHTFSPGQEQASRLRHQDGAPPPGGVMTCWLPIGRGSRKATCERHQRHQ
jgi:hypothetical protein